MCSHLSNVNQTGSIVIKLLLIGVFVSMLFFFFNNPFGVSAVTDITTCQTISSAGEYRLTSNIGSGGTCITVTVNGVDIDGGDFTINGNIIADAPTSVSGGLHLTLRNITVQGYVYARGYQSTSGGTVGGEVTLVDSTVQNDIYVTGGSGVSLSQAVLGDTAQTGAAGAAGGTVTLTDSTVANIYATGGTGADGQQGFNGEVVNNVYGASGGDGGNGGTGGQVTVLRSTVQGQINVTGGTAGAGGAGGDGFSGLAGEDSAIDATSGGDGGPAGVAGNGGVSGNGGTVTITDSVVTSVIVSGGDGSAGGRGGLGGNGGNGGNALTTGLNAGNGGNGNSGGSGGNGGNGGNAGAATVLRSTVTTIDALGGDSGQAGNGGNGGNGGIGGDTPIEPDTGNPGNGGNGGTGGATGQNFGQNGNGGNVSVTDSSVTNINIAIGQAGTTAIEGHGGEGGIGGTGFSSSGSTGTSGTDGTYIGNSPSAATVGSISLTNNPPSITITGANPMDITVGSSFIDPGATVQDAKDSSLTASVSGTVNTAVVGEYILTYTVTDLPISPLVDGVSAPGYIAAAQSDLKTRTVRVLAQVTAPASPEPVVLPGSQSGGGFSSTGFTSSGETLVHVDPPTGVQVSFIDKIISIFTGRKSDAEILQILNLPETHAIMDSELSQNSAEPFNRPLEENLKSLGAKSCPVFTATILPNNKNNDADQVRLWQKFYNQLFGSNLQVTGGYDIATIAETNRFQRVFKNIVLLPWGIEDATSNIYITTRYAANSLIGCEQE